MHAPPETSTVEIFAVPHIQLGILSTPTRRRAGLAIVERRGMPSDAKPFKRVGIPPGADGAQPAHAPQKSRTEGLHVIEGSCAAEASRFPAYGKTDMILHFATQAQLE